MQRQPSFSSRLWGVLAIVLCSASIAFADTIRLRDGSVIRGDVTGFGNGQFTVLIGSGARGRRSSVTLYPEDIESIEFDDVAGAAGNSGTPVPSSVVTSTGTTSGAAPRASTEQPAAPTTATAANNNRQPIFEQRTIRVRADATTNGWTNSGITVRRGQRLRVTASGRVTLGENRAATPAGLRNIADANKLMRDEATGALIAVIGDDNDDFIFLGARREFTAQRDGVLFLGINEGELADNTGSFEAAVGYEVGGN